LALIPPAVVKAGTAVAKNIKPTITAVSAAAGVFANRIPQIQKTGQQLVATVQSAGEQSTKAKQAGVTASVTFTEPVMIDIPVVREADDLPVAYHKHDYDAGYDLYALEDVWFWPFQTKIVKTNVRMQIPPGFQLRVAGRSGMAASDWWTHHGTVDCGYIGNIGVILKNMRPWPRKIKRGQRIAQAVLWPVVYMNFVEVKELKETKRGESGFGASGKF